MVYGLQGPKTRPLRVRSEHGHLSHMKGQDMNKRFSLEALDSFQGCCSSLIAQGSEKTGPMFAANPAIPAEPLQLSDRPPISAEASRTPK